MLYPLSKRVCYSVILFLINNLCIAQIDPLLQKIDSKPPAVDDEVVHDYVFKMPDLLSSQKAMDDFAFKNMKYPFKARLKKTEGDVKIDFVVNKNFDVKSFKIGKEAESELENEALRLFKLMSSQWTFKSELGGNYTYHGILRFEFRSKREYRRIFLEKIE